MMELLTIEELIEHCNRQLKRVPSGTKTYQEHESVRLYLQWLRHYTATKVSPNGVRELVEENKRLHKENFWLTSEQEPGPRWTAMADNLPPEDGSYIVCTRRGAVCTAHFNVKTGRWGHSLYGVTHWMPLPKAPGEEG